MVDGESSEVSKDQHPTSNSPSRYDRIVVGLSSVALAVGALVGAVFAVMEWRAHQPSVEFTFADSEIRKNYIDLRDTLETLNDIESEYGGITGFFIIDLIGMVDGLDDTDSSRVSSLNEKIKAVVQEYEQKFGDDSEVDEKELLSRVRELASRIDSNSKAPNSNFIMQVDVENRSRLPNVIRREAVVRMWKTGRRFSDIDVYLKGNSHAEIQGLVAKRLTYESRYSNQMDEHVQEFLESGDVGEWNCLMLIKDMRGRIWRNDDICAANVAVIASLMRFEASLIFERLEK